MTEDEHTGSRPGKSNESRKTVPEVNPVMLDEGMSLQVGLKVVALQKKKLVHF